MTSLNRTHRTAQVLMAATITMALAGCCREEEVAPSGADAQGSQKTGWSQTLVTPAQVGYNYTNQVAHPADVSPATALDVVRVTFDTNTGLYVYTVEYVEDIGAPAKTDVWTLPIIFTNKDEHDVFTDANVVDHGRVIYGHEDKPPVRDGL